MKLSRWDNNIDHHLGKTCFICGKLIDAQTVAASYVFDQAPYSFDVYSVKPMKAQIMNENDEMQPAKAEFRHQYAHKWCLLEREQESK